MRSLPRTLFAAALALILSAPQALATPIAKIKAAEGVVEIQRNGRWRRAREGTELTVADSIRTGPNALAQIEFYDADAESGAQATNIDMAPESEVSIAHFEISKSLPRQRQGLVDVAKGYLRTFTKGWASGSIFSVKAGTTVCGIRGSVADVAFNPATGTASFTSLDGTMYTFQATDLASAIRMSLEIGTDLAAGRTPTIAYSMAVGDVVEGGRGVVATLTPEQVAQATAVSGEKAWQDGNYQTWNKIFSSNTQEGQDLGDKIYFGETTNDAVLNAITQEILSSPQLNGEISTK